MKKPREKIPERERVVSAEAAAAASTEVPSSYRQDKGGQFMDTTAPVIGVSPDLARESLIAISQVNPDKNLSASKLWNGNSNKVNGHVAVDESDKDYRSKLISISYTQSADGEKIPTSPKNLLN